MTNNNNKWTSANEEKYDRLLDIYNKLQVLSVLSGVELPIPEAVVVGKQSGGKSGLVDAFVGFHFNDTRSGIATRRPIILQLEKAKGKTTPEWDVLPGGPSFTSCASVREYIRARNDEVAHAQVSDVPVILRMRYEACESLTIIDLPGFRLDPGISENILNAVRKVLVKKPKAVLIAVDEATQQFANNVAVNRIRNDLKEQCDNFSERTIVVLNKFDLMLSQWEANDVSARFAVERMEDGFDDPDFGASPRFWTSNPDYDAQPELNNKLSDANIFAVWHNDRSTKDREITKRRTNGHKFASDNVGVDKLKNFIKWQLFEKYQEQVPEVVGAIGKKSKEVEDKINVLNVQLRDDLIGTKDDDMRRLFSRLVSAFVTVQQELLRSPAALGDAYTKKYGHTLDEELTIFKNNGLAVRDLLLDGDQLVEELHPGSPERAEQIAMAKQQFLHAFDGYENLRNQFITKVPPQSKAYAGWQYTRILEDIQLAVRSVEPAEATLMQGVGIGTAHVSVDLLVNQWVGLGSKKFIPIFDAICVRFYNILERMFAIVYEIASTTSLTHGADPTLRPFASLPSVYSTMQEWYMGKVKMTLKEARKRLLYFLESCVEVLGGSNAVMFDPDLPTEVYTATERVRREMENIVCPPDLPQPSDSKDKSNYQLKQRHRWCFAQVRHHLAQSLEPNLAMLIKNVLFFSLRQSAATFPYDVDMVSFTGRPDVVALVGARVQREAQKAELEKKKATLVDMVELAKQLKSA